MNNRWGYYAARAPPTIDPRRATPPPNPACTGDTPKALVTRRLREGYPHALIMGINRQGHTYILFFRPLSGIPSVLVFWIGEAGTP